MSWWSQQLQRMQEETACQIGYKLVTRGRVEHHLRLSQWEETLHKTREPEVLFLAQRPKTKPTRKDKLSTLSLKSQL